MRELKFRAWDLQHENMVDWGQAIRNFKMDEFFTPQDNFELMQYTGLKDKNGVEIYEGDLIRMAIDTSNEDVRAVEFDEGGFWLTDKPAYEWPLAFIEVIGNIYENKDLLK